ncbi:MAG: hypothetical protein QGG42_16420 [Phycisphaerae bacterium]|jgi:hypothetical protein|nr:hypothetical protein [Phycisphaerae bacterium]
MIRFMHTRVVLSPKPKGVVPVTMWLESGNMGFTKPRPDDTDAPFITHDYPFTWDGTKKPLGYHFPPGVPVAAGLGADMPSNTEFLTPFKIQLANMSKHKVKSNDEEEWRQQVNGHVHLTLDEKPFKSVPVVIPGNTHLYTVDLMPKDKDDKYYSLLNHPIKPGPHRFDVQFVIEGQGEPIDKFSIKFTIGPAVPQGVTQTRTGNKVKLSWKPNPEEGAGLGPIAYVVWKDNRPKTIVRGTTWVDTLRSGDKAEHSYRLEAVAIQSDLKTLQRELTLKNTSGWLTSRLAKPQLVDEKVDYEKVLREFAKEHRWKVVSHGMTMYGPPWSRDSNFAWHKIASSRLEKRKSVNGHKAQIWVTDSAQQALQEIEDLKKHEKDPKRGGRGIREFNNGGFKTVHPNRIGDLESFCAVGEAVLMVTVPKRSPATFGRKAILQASQQDSQEITKLIKRLADMVQKEQQAAGQ